MDLCLAKTPDSSQNSKLFQVTPLDYCNVLEYRLPVDLIQNCRLLINSVYRLNLNLYRGLKTSSIFKTAGLPINKVNSS